MRRLSAFAIALLAPALLLAACGGGGPVGVTGVTLSNVDGGPAMTTFAPTDHTIYAEIALNQTASGLNSKLVWTAVDTTAGQNIEVASKDVTGVVANTITGNVSLPNDWPTGTYKLDVYLNGALANTTPYSV